MKLPKIFKSILWFTDFDKLSVEDDRELILFQTLEKGRMEHLRYVVKKYGKKTVYNFALRNARKFSRKSIINFVEVVLS